MSNTVESDIRALVRELLRDIVPQPAIDASRGARTVNIATAADLTEFAALVLDLARDPAVERDIRSGLLRFEPGTNARTVTAPAPPNIPVLRIDKGAVTEKIITRAAENGTRLVLGRRAVITPLAKEAARKNGVGIERVS